MEEQKRWKHFRNEGGQRICGNKAKQRAEMGSSQRLRSLANEKCVVEEILRKKIS